MNSKKKYCLFPKLQFSHFLFLFYFISAMMKQYIFNGTKRKDNLSIPVFKLYVHNIGDFIAIIPYLIIKKKTKSYNAESIKKNNKVLAKIIYIDIFKKKKQQIFFYIFVMCLLDFIAQISTTTFYLIAGHQKLQVKSTNLNAVLVFNVMFLFLVTKFIMDIKYYLHHYISFIMFIICLTVMTIIDFTAIESKDVINSLLYMVIRIFAVLLYAISNNLIKIIFLRYYFSPYLLLLLKAIIHFVFLIIFSIPLIFVKFSDEKGENKIIFSMICDIFEEKILILFYIIYIISSFFYNILNYLIIDKFSPTHTSIAFISENLAIFIINTITKDTNIDYKFGIRLVMYILLIIACGIFDEFWVINICGMANGTKLFLDYKEQNDLILIDEICYKDNKKAILFVDNNEENDDNIAASSFRSTVNLELKDL